MRWNPKLRRRHTLLILFTGYALLMLFGGCANKFILFPSRQTIDPVTAKRVLVPTGSNRNVEVWVDRSLGISATEPQAYVIEFTGNATRAEQVATYSAMRWGAKPIE